MVCYASSSTPPFGTRMTACSKRPYSQRSSTRAGSCATLRSRGHSSSAVNAFRYRVRWQRRSGKSLGSARCPSHACVNSLGSSTESVRCETRRLHGTWPGPRFEISLRYRGRMLNSTHRPEKISTRPKRRLHCSARRFLRWSLPCGPPPSNTSEAELSSCALLCRAADWIALGVDVMRASESFRLRLEHSEGLQITVDTMLRGLSQLQREGRCGIEPYSMLGAMPWTAGIPPVWSFDWRQPPEG